MTLKLKQSKPSRERSIENKMQAMEENEGYGLTSRRADRFQFLHSR